MKLVALLALLAVTSGACQFLRPSGRGTVPLAVAGRGTFECGSGFHGCTAWLAIRPAGWQKPGQWAPGRDDRDFRPSPRDGDRSMWRVAGAGVGGPGGLRPGDYRFMAVITEADDTKPWAPGTDDEPGTGVLSLTIACESPVTVPEGATGIAVTVAFGPGCSIEAVPDLP